MRELHREFAHEFHEQLVLFLELREFPESRLGGNLPAEPFVDCCLMETVLLCSIGNGDTIILDAFDDLLLDLGGNSVAFCHILEGEIVQSVSKIWGTCHPSLGGEKNVSGIGGAGRREKIYVT